MPRRFTDAQALLADLLDRHEAGTASPIAYPDYPAFVSVVATDAFIRVLQQAEQAGAVSVAFGKGTWRDQIVHVRLGAANALLRPAASRHSASNCGRLSVPLAPLMPWSP